MPASADLSRPLALLPYGDDPLARLAAHLFAEHPATLPDLSQVTVLLPNLAAASRLRAQLLDEARRHGLNALLGPRITTLPIWISEQDTAAGEVLSDHARELLLHDAIAQHPSLYGEANPWSLVDSLLALFDELTLNQVELPASLADFEALLHRAYGLGQPLPGAAREAALVHTLWQAWQEQQHAEGRLDRFASYLLALGRTAGRIPAGQTLYLAGHWEFSTAERTWLKSARATGQLRLIFHGQTGLTAPAPTHPDAVLAELLAELETEPPEAPPETSPYSACLNAVFATEKAPLRQRASDFSTYHPNSPLEGRLRLLGADSAEHEALAIDVQVRGWLLAGCRNIGIVTENRRLARRLRALLERAGVQVQDAAGWALSTTSAAATLERWLEAVEEDFAHQPLLDLLKSPFVLADWEIEQRLQATYRLEHDVILHENTPRGLHRYRSQLLARAARLKPEFTADPSSILALLDRLAEAADPLLPLLTGLHPLRAFLESLQHSLQRLGMAEGFAEDAAGHLALDELALLDAAASDGNAQSWVEFRAWLGRALERANFHPPASPGPVQLMGVLQTPLCRFDALIVAGAEQSHLPGVPPSSPFFNDAVRSALNLSSSRRAIAARAYHFRRVLESSARVLITYRRQQDGEEVMSSAWVRLIEAFHHLAYGRSLEDAELANLARDQRAWVSRADTNLLPTPLTAPAPSIPAQLLPTSISASSYQQLIDCPYQFFLSQCLGLTPPDEIRETLEKSDYGNHVHRCLEALHRGSDGLPGPFGGVMTRERRTEAIQLLDRIAQAVFSRDLEDNFLHRGWLKRWQELIPHYIDWQIAREQTARVGQVEARVVQTEFLDGIELRGRIDRIDQTPDGSRSIIDYKTGWVPRDEDILAGEAVQLPFYSLLLGPAVGKVEFLRLEQPQFGTKAQLEGDALRQLTTAVAERLKDILQQLRNGAPLPAWGDEDTCGRCTLAGVCRRPAWDDTAEGE